MATQVLPPVPATPVLNRRQINLAFGSILVGCGVTEDAVVQWELRRRLSEIAS